MERQVRRLVKADELNNGDTLRLFEIEYRLTYRRNGEFYERRKNVGFRFERYNRNNEFKFWVQPGELSEKSEALKRWRSVISQENKRYKDES